MSTPLLLNTFLLSGARASRTVSLLLILVILVWKLVSYLRSNPKLWRKSFRRKGGVSNDQELLLSIGLLTSESKGLLTDTLIQEKKTATEAIESLKSDWNITDTASARKNIKWISAQGFRTGYAAILPLAMIDMPEDKRFEIVKQSLKTEKDSNPKAANRLARALTTLSKGKYAAFFREEHLYKGILAWDMAYLVFVARTAACAGYITEDEARESITLAYEECTRRYSSWLEIAVANCIGSAMEYGADKQTIALLDLTQKALNDPNSPWVRIPFKS